MVQVDKGQMNQAINNIVLNAIQAMPEGGMIEVSAANMSLDSECGIPVQPGAHIRISIQDHGIGICEEHIQRIFDPFFTTDESRSGLGLSTAYSIIKNHNGYITVESQVGTGTTFHIYLPAFPQEALPVAGIVSEEKEEAIASGGKILVVDDEELIRDLVIEMLNSLGYEAAVARDGAEAIALYKSAMEAEEPFDAVILDLIVPGGMGGEGIIRELTWIDPEIKAVVSSGYSIDPIMTDFRRHGFRGAIAKPYNIKELDQILRQVLAANTSYHQR